MHVGLVGWAACSVWGLHFVGFIFCGSCGVCIGLIFTQSLKFSISLLRFYKFDFEICYGQTGDPKVILSLESSAVCMRFAGSDRGQSRNFFFTSSHSLSEENQGSAHRTNPEGPPRGAPKYPQGPKQKKILSSKGGFK